MSDPKKLLCARAAGVDRQRHVARGTIFTNVCSVCGEKVCTAPTGQAILAADPTITIVCMKCFEPEQGDTFDVPEGAIEEIEQWMRERGSN